MSRHILHNRRYEMAYGQDHICGLFLQIFDRERANEEDEGLVVDLDEERDSLSPERMAQVAEDYGFHIDLGEDTIQI